MNRSNRILPVYAGDVSGACSALFELGGMVVIHDPSGCNSTYNTHDETRWYDYDSLIFISALMERDAILGNDEKLVNDVVDAARELQPRFVALCNSPIPFMMGTDFAALCKILERRCGVPCFYVQTNGMHDYTMGAGYALAEVARRFVEADDPQPRTLNLLGVTPLDFYRDEALPALRAFVQEAGYETASCWAQGSTLDEMARASRASVNLVVSSTGLYAARALRERFGTPYVVGTPEGAFARVLAESLREAEEAGVSSWPCNQTRRQAPDGTRCIIGEPVAAASMAAARELVGEGPLRVVSPLEMAREVLGEHDATVYGEEEIEQALASARSVVADALYAPVCPPAAQLEAWPHLAFSGRNCFAQRPGEAWHA